MKDVIINNIKFTQTEFKVLSCFTDSDASKPSTIAKILDKSPSTIYSHLDKVKGKINCHAIDGISLFVRKSNYFNELKNCFYKQYIDYYYLEIAKKIAYKLKSLSIVYNLIVPSKLNDNKIINDIIKSIELTSIKVNKIEDLQLFLKKSFDLESQQFCLYIAQNLEELEHFQTVTKKLKQNNLYLVLNKPSKQTLPFEEANVLFFNQNNKKEFYRFLINHLVQNHQIVATLDKKSKFLSEINNLEKNIKTKALTSIDIDDKKNKELMFSFNVRSLAMIISALVLTVIVVISIYYNLQKPFSHGFADRASNYANTNQNNNIISFKLPNQLNYYAPRVDLTTEIWDKLKEGEKEQRKAAIFVGLHGLGGIGKTTLALNAIHNPKYTYAFRGWFSAETEELLKSDYFELGEKMFLFAKEMSEKVKISNVKDWLNNQNNILLVYDNAPNIEMLADYLPNNGDVIITSRNHKLPGAIEIDVMTKTEALNLLNKLIPKQLQKANEYQQQIEKLVSKLGYLPLAISQAGAYICENMLTITDYLKLYDEQKEKLLRERTLPPGDKHEAAYITWDMNIQTIKQLPSGDKSLELLDIIAYCYPENIPKELLIQHLYNKNNSGAKIAFNKALGLLRQYSLIKVSSDVVSIHRLVHDWAKHKHSKKDKLAILKQGINAIKSIHSSDNKTLEEISFIKKLLPHIETMLSHVEPLVSEITYAKLIYILGDNYFIIGEHEKSRGFYSRYLGVIEKHFGSESVKTAKALSKVGNAYGELGDYTKAQQFFEKALAIQEKQLGTDNIQSALVYRKLGVNYFNVGNFIKAKQLLKKALAIQKKHYAPLNIKVGHTLRYLGWNYICLGDYINAKRSLEESFSIVEKRYGSNHLYTSWTARYLGLVYLSLGDYVKAEQLLTKDVLINEKQYGPLHMETSHALSNLANCYLHLGNYIKAQKLLEKVLTIHYKVYGNQHIHTALTLDSIGFAYLGLGNYNDAKKALEETLRLVTTVNKQNDSVTAILLANIGNMHRILNDNQESKKRLEQALILLENTYGPNNIIVAKVLGNIGLLYGNLGNNAKKKELLEKALVIFKKDLYSTHADIKNTLDELNKINSTSKEVNENNNRQTLGYLIVLPN